MAGRLNINAYIYIYIYMYIKTKPKRGSTAAQDAFLAARTARGGFSSAGWVLPTGDGDSGKNK